ncbi:concanavalin A-like lectin/glucanase domain-containing protein [Endogone sp. FLAS-F59071]|nr:concanavalin A-like lectin/glucanase domain-containing protein [Endogone sp. FLAS-F59071]|eukprot:RUS15691.1 concanavalin A-like lectin/glucanase domain-containing protein [Endogone sp. FLAS-F59071]
MAALSKHLHLLLLVLMALFAVIEAAPKKATSTPKPVCRSYTETFQKAKIISEDDYNGKQSVDWIDLSDDSKTWKQTSQGLQMNLLKPSQYVPLKGYNKYVGNGATLNSSHLMQYGSVSAFIKVASVPGSVTAFITMSNGGDEIDVEWVGGDSDHFQSNYFYHGIPLYGVNGGNHKVSGASVSAAFHTYTINWEPEFITWSVDGVVMRNKTRASTLSSGTYHFPTEATRIQIGIWDGSSSPGTASWANGPINWNKAGSVISAYIKSIKIECNPLYNTVIN